MESERRQIFFGAAIGIPTFYVRKNSTNLFLKKILTSTGGIRPSHRYPGYLRVPLQEYRRALVQILLEDGGDLIELLNLRGTMENLRLRLELPTRHSAGGRLTAGILETLGARTPMDVKADAFNQGAETYYRGMLRRQHLQEALRFLEEDFLQCDLGSAGMDEQARETLGSVLGGMGAADFLRRVKTDLLEERLPVEALLQLINLVIITIHHDTSQAEKVTGISSWTMTFEHQYIERESGAVERKSSTGTGSSSFSITESGKTPRSSFVSAPPPTCRASSA